MSESSFRSNTSNCGWQYCWSPIRPVSSTHNRWHSSIYKMVDRDIIALINLPVYVMYLIYTIVHSIKFMFKCKHCPNIYVQLHETPMWCHCNRYHSCRAKNNRDTVEVSSDRMIYSRVWPALRLETVGSSQTPEIGYRFCSPDQHRSAHYVHLCSGQDVVPARRHLDMGKRSPVDSIRWPASDFSQHPMACSANRSELRFRTLTSWRCE